VGLKAIDKPIGGTAGWCQIDQPMSDCVKVEFLQFSGGGGLPDGAAGLR
jgi:hypothetical protein